MLKDRAKLQLTLQVLWESCHSLGRGTGQHWHLSLLGGDRPGAPTLPPARPVTGIATSTAGLRARADSGGIVLHRVSAVSYLFQVSGSHGAEHLQGYSMVSKDWHVLFSGQLD